MLPHRHPDHFNLDERLTAATITPSDAQIIDVAVVDHVTKRIETAAE
ncbi:MAG TPA: hypothetical protein VJ673_10050 [Aromatoleum sp.]|nr:hypothetical protein [Aromatoleum sp.]HJV26023.1 hypothetical protein [Aromatoleum sp.]